jgi:hypothetical protein
MIHRVIKKASIILLPLLATGALAQDTELEEEPVEVRRYTVEMLIFAYEQSLSGGSEIFMPDEPPPFEFGDDQDLIDFILGDGAVPVDAAEPDLPELTEVELIVRQRLEDVDERYAFVMLPEEDFVLTDVVAGLDELDAYIPLMHFGWTQPMYSAEETEVRPLGSFATPPEGLEGDLSLYLSRYLHLTVNLQMDSTTLEKMANSLEPEDSEELSDSESSKIEEEMSDRYNFGDGIYEIGFDDMDDDGIVTYPIRYRMEEDRIVRNGELRYYDHPRFGVLAKITRVEEQEPDEFEEELLGYDGE